MSTKFPPVILGPEMAAPILWAPGIFWFFLLENPHAHKIPPLRGGGVGFFRRGGVEVPILFYGRGDVSFPVTTSILDIPCVTSTGKVQKHQKTSYGAKTG